VVLETQQGLQQGYLAVIRYLTELHQPVAAVVGQEHRLKTAQRAGLVAVVLVIVVLVGRGILHQQAHHKETAGPQAQRIRVAVGAAQMLPDRLMVTVEMERQAVFLVPLSLMAAGVGVAVALLKHPLVRAVLVVAVQGQVVLPHQQRGL